MSTDTTLKVEQRPLSAIKPYAKNPRRNDAAVEKVAASIREFGWAQPIVVDGDGVIIIGHTRLKAAKKLGLKTAPVLVRADLSPEQVAALRLADNKTAEFAEWDMPLLNAELDSLLDTELDMKQFGFEDAEFQPFDDVEESREMQTQEFVLFDGVKIPISEAEHSLLREALDNHIEKNGVYNGFFRNLFSRMR